MDKKKPYSKAVEGLKAVAERNHTEHQRAVSTLIRLTGNARAIKNNEQRNNDGGR